MVLHVIGKKNELSDRARFAWSSLCKDFSLSDTAAQSLMNYMQELHDWNQKTNLTRITDWYEVIEYHIRDSLEFAKAVDCAQQLLICDVGTGGGLPAIPLKIVYPHLDIILIEVVERKVAFLHHIIEQFNLEGIEVCTLDWRTFLRTTDATIHYFVARASLRPDELLRAYKSGCAYQKASIVYWAAESWVPTVQEQKFIRSEHTYATGDKRRRLIFFEKLL